MNEPEPVKCVRCQIRDATKTDGQGLAVCGWCVGGHAPTMVHDQPRVGRNAPCPCGSGKKYKTCCLARNPKAAVLRSLPKQGGVKIPQIRSPYRKR
jgi:hypothetical protein